MTNLPESFTAALKKQIAEQYSIILRYRSLKNDASAPEQRKKFGDEISLRQQNIEEIQHDFLNQVQAGNHNLSIADIRQMLADSIDQIKREMENRPATLAQNPVTDNPQEVIDDIKKIKLLASRNMKRAFKNTHTLLTKHPLEEDYTPLVGSLQNRYDDIEQRNIRGSISYSQYNVGKNNILRAFLGLLDDIKDELS